MKSDSQLVAKLIDAIPNLIAIYQFGSQEHGETHSASDIDVAFLAEQPMSSVKRFDMAQEQASLCHKEVDLIHLRVTTTVMRMQVISTGRCLFLANDVEREKFETLVYSSYARLNEERQGILSDIRRRGASSACRMMLPSMRLEDLPLQISKTMS